MRTSKRWTNTTFTRRVDHEAGKHHEARPGKGPRICERCGNAYVKGRWVTSAAAPIRTASLRLLADPITTLCPACHMAAEGLFSGEVRISGAFAVAHRTEIKHLVENEARRDGEDNPLARILDLNDRDSDRLIVRTTTEHLAKRIGQALEKAFDGEVHYEFSHENKFAHVTWSRDH